MKEREMVTGLVRGKGEAYVFLAEEDIGTQFMREAGREGFVFGDGVSAADRKAGDIMCIGENRRICYVGYAGHMAYSFGRKNGKPIARIDYAEYRTAVRTKRTHE